MAPCTRDCGPGTMHLGPAPRHQAHAPAWDKDPCTREQHQCTRDHRQGTKHHPPWTMIHAPAPFTRHRGSATRQEASCTRDQPVGRPRFKFVRGAAPKDELDSSNFSLEQKSDRLILKLAQKRVREKCTLGSVLNIFFLARYNERSLPVMSRNPWSGPPGLVHVHPCPSHKPRDHGLYDIVTWNRTLN